MAGLEQEPVRYIKGTVSMIDEGAVRWSLVRSLLIFISDAQLTNLLADFKSLGRGASRVVYRGCADWGCGQRVGCHWVVDGCRAPEDRSVRSILVMEGRMSDCRVFVLSTRLYVPRFFL